MINYTKVYLAFCRRCNSCSHHYKSTRHCVICAHVTKMKYNREVGRFRHHGITRSQAIEILRNQNNACGLCGQKITLSTGQIDHEHGCRKRHRHEIHRGRLQKFGCPACIRGFLCPICNGRVLPTLERVPALQSVRTKQYLKRRPFLHV